MYSNTNTGPVNYYARFCDKLSARKFSVGVIGMGYVGLPLALLFAQDEIPVMGFDTDADKVNQLNAGKSYIRHIRADRIGAALACSGKPGLVATTDFSLVPKVDAIIICVPTPLGKHDEPDMDYIKYAMESIEPHLRQGQLLVLESTTYPGTTEELLVPWVTAQGYTVGDDFFVAFSPEREDPGNENFTTANIPKLVGGVTSNCTDLAAALYSTVLEKVVPVSSPKVAEMAKLLENIHRAVNIGLVNEMKLVADKMGVDIFEVIDAAATKPFGFVPYKPGPGLGGHCIPIDPFYLTWKAKEYGVHTRFIELAGQVNNSMPEYVVSKVAEALNDKSCSLRGSRILVLGVAYKKDVDDVRESPALAIMQRLIASGAYVSYYDPYIPRVTLCGGSVPLASLPSWEGALYNPHQEVDCVVLLTDHSCFDYSKLRSARIECQIPIVDTRGVFPSRLPYITRA